MQFVCASGVDLLATSHNDETGDYVSDNHGRAD